MAATARIFALIALITLASYLPTGESIKCYDCNSYKKGDEDCALEKPPAKFQKDCPPKSQSSHDKPYVLCRKIVQSIEYEVNGLKPDLHRVIRSCGWDNSSYADRCYQRSGFGGRQEVCSCTTDYCNTAPSTFAATTLIAFLLALAFGANL